MRITKIGFLFIAALMFSAALPCLAAEESAFTATEDFCYWCVCDTCGAGTFTMLPNGGIQIRNSESIYFETVSNGTPGYYRTAFNLNGDASMAGQMWGTFYSCDQHGERLSDGFEGTWNGRIFSVFPYSNWINENIGRGYGAYKGQIMKSTTAYGDSTTGTVVGVIQYVNEK